MPSKVSFSAGDDDSQGSGINPLSKRKVTALTSYESLVAGGDKLKEVLLQRKNANFDKLAADILKEGLQQKLAAIYYNAINDYLLFAPTMAITLLSAVLSIFGTSQIVRNNDSKIGIGVFVAILQLVLSLFQSIQKQLNFGGKAGFHQSASTALKNLYETAQHNITESRYQAIVKAFKTDGQLGLDDWDGDDSSDDEYQAKGKKADDESSVGSAKGKAKAAAKAQKTAQMESAKKDKDANDSLATQFQQAVEQVDSLIPINIEAAFQMLESRITVINQSLMVNRTASLVAWERVLPALYYQLSETIIEYRYWPIMIPPPQDSVEKALIDFKTAIDVDQENAADLLMTIVERSNEIFDVKQKIAAQRADKERTAHLEELKAEKSMKTLMEDV